MIERVYYSLGGIVMLKILMKYRVYSIDHIQLTNNI